MVLIKLNTFFVTMGVGKIPWAPGTWGTLVGLILWWFWGLQDIQWASTVIVAVFIVAWPCVQLYEATNKSHDPKEVVIDEALGIWITLLAVPWTFGTFFVGFLLFRFFDILKPFPIGWVDRRVPGAFGTIADDLIAGLMARLVLGGLLLLEWEWMMT